MHMKRQKYILPLIVLAVLTACDSSDVPIQHPDNYDNITFSAQTQKLITRVNPYEAYDNNRHPATMGVFGYYDIAGYAALTRATTPALPNPIFGNDITNYDTTTKTWATTATRRWDDYKGATSFDFLAYMPHTAGANVERTDKNTYTLSVPFSMPTAAPFISDTKEAPIICVKPEHKEGTDATGKQFTFERIVNLQFDQTLTAYNLLFMLTSKMNAIRQFRIKSVTISGEIATSGTITRTYSWANNSWTAYAIQWTGITRQASTASPVAITYKSYGTEAYNDDTQTALITSSGYTQWGPTFYTIPDAKFMPTISVTYDVVFMDEKQQEVITRKDVTSNIILNKNNFPSLTTGTTAMINPIRILIQPHYLYVLADQDAYTGQLLIQ